MRHRVSRPAAALLAIVISLSVPSAAFAARRDRGMDPGDGPRIIQLLKKIAKKFGIVSHDDEIISPAPPKP